MKLGIADLPNVNKSTLFNSLTRADTESADYSFCATDPNAGAIPIPDERLKLLKDLYRSRKVTPTVIEFVDIAGLVKGASKDKGLGNRFLSGIREVDATVHVVRCFKDASMIHVNGSVDLLRDIEAIDLELTFLDIEILDRRIAETAKAANNDKPLTKELVILRDMKIHLEDRKLARGSKNGDKDATAFINNLNLLTQKPVVFVANVSGDDLVDDRENNPYVRKVRKFVEENASQVFVICAQTRQEAAKLEEDGKKTFLEELGLRESGLEKLIAASYELLGLISYLTSGEDETRTWTIKIGTKAPQTAGKIHTGFERGFIRIEVMNYQDLLDCKICPAAKKGGLVRLEGKNYVIEDSDVILLRFDV